MTPDLSTVHPIDSIALEASGEWTLLLRQECCLGIAEKSTPSPLALPPGASPVHPLMEGIRAIASLSWLIAIACLAGVLALSSPLTATEQTDETGPST